jgi:hypothetical protein
MPEKYPNPDELLRLTEHGEFLLRSYQSELLKDRTSRDAEFWRGEFSGFRSALEIIYGRGVHTDVMKRLRDAGFKIPHSGLMD